MAHILDGGGERGLVEGELDEGGPHEHVAPAVDDDALAGALVQEAQLEPARHSILRAQNSESQQLLCPPSTLAECPHNLWFPADCGRLQSGLQGVVHLWVNGVHEHQTASNLVL